MWLLISIAMVVLLYAKSLRYNYMPDDMVPRGEYLYNVPETLPPAEFCKKVPPVRVRVWCIANHCLNVAFINVLFGWKAALIFAVHPIAVSQVCWITGNYYAGTTLLVLASYWCIHTFGWFGAVPGIAFYIAALNSTLTALGVPFFFLMTMNPVGMTLFIPLIVYLKGDRFTKGLQIRKDMRKRDFDKIEFKKIGFMTKVVYEYVGMFFVPLRLALFRTFGENVTRSEEHYKKDCSFNNHFWDAFITCSVLLGVGLWLNPMAVLWFFCMIAPHSQFKVYGQSNPCDRYLYLPMIGLCILMGYLPEPLLFMFAGFFAYRSYLYIPSWKNQTNLHKYNLDQFPERPMSYSDYGQYLLTTVAPEDPIKINEASYYIQRAKQLADSDGKAFEVYLNFAFFLMTFRDTKGALHFTKEAIDRGIEQGLHGRLLKTLEDQVTGLTGMLEKEEFAKKEEEAKKCSTPLPQ